MNKTNCDPQKIIAQLHRISGQVSSVEKMYNERRDIEEIIRVVMAARASLDSVSRMLITDKVQGCFDGNQVSQQDDLVKLVNTLFKTT